MLSQKSEVLAFLRDVRSIVSDPDFNISKQLDVLPKKKDESPTDPYTTVNTLLALEYDMEDVRNQLLLLDLKDYIETVTDNRDASLPPFFVFGRSIQNREVYIKLKIKKNRVIFCVSFHYARHPLPDRRPYIKP